MHNGQLRVDTALAARLVAEQHPQWAGLPVRPVLPGGTVNAVFRLGERLALRFPLRPDDGADQVRVDLQREAAAAARLAGRTPVPTPEPVALGEPGAGHPLPWAMQTWVPGTPADTVDVAGSDALATDLAGFVAAVAAVPLAGARFAGRGRGGDLRSQDDWLETCFAHSTDLMDVPALRALWRRWRTLPRTAPDVCTHGDLIPGNLLVESGPTDGSVRLVGVVDVGGCGPADPALDLVVAWHVLDAGPRTVFRRALGVDDLGWERGRAWAFAQAMGLPWYYRDSHPGMRDLGLRTLNRLLGRTASPGQ